MIVHKYISERALFATLKDNSQVIQIKTSHEDSAIYYLTPIISTSNNIINIIIHEGSLLLDRIRLFGTFAVLVEIEGKSFRASLSQISKTAGCRLEILELLV